MRKVFLLLIALLLAAPSIFSQNNLLTDGSFEKLSADDQLPRIAAFSDFGKQIQVQNPTKDAAAVQYGVWYRKSLNSAYLKATVVDSESHDGTKAIMLSVNNNSPQAKLNNWFSNTLTQYVALDKKQYTITFYAKSIKGDSRIFAGIANAKGGTMKGSKWLDITSQWAEYTLVVNSDSKQADAALIIGLETLYDAADKTLASSVVIDNIQLYEK